MAKKKPTRRKSTKSNKSKKSAAPQASLPHGFWSQVGAVFLIAISVLFVVAWFNAGGPVLEWMHDATMKTVGYGMYVLPVFFVYMAVEIFRSDNSRLSILTKFSAIMLIIWFSGLFGLMKDAKGQSTGGFVGDVTNTAMLALVNNGVAAFIYVLLIIVTTLLLLRITPAAVIRGISDLVRTSTAEEDENVKVMRKAAAADAKSGKTIKSMGEIKLNAGVPTLSAEEVATVDKKSKNLTSLRGSVKQDKVAEDQAALVSVSDPNWQAPSVEILEKKQSPADAGDVQQNAQTIRDTLGEFNIDVEMEGANIGPKVTQYTLKPPSGVKLTRITALETNIALNLAAQSLRIEAPIPGQRAVGIEVPNRKAADVRLYGILTSKQWKQNHEPLSFAIGKDISGEAVVGELNKMPHLLIAGQTGSGKSVMINTLLTSLLYRNSPSEMKLILVDPKQVEMAPYEDIPHLLTPVITEPEKTISALKWAVNEMERRYKLLAGEKIRDIKTYNQKIQSGNKKITVEDDDGNPQRVDDGAMPYIVIVIDELADLMMVAARDVEALIVRLAQKARAVGIHLVLATQRPSVDVLLG
ncbi:MAG: DNA translocase FtsK 4TM domain-containing protein [Candidatus Saccharimonadales bacterium]